MSSRNSTLLPWRYCRCNHLVTQHAIWSVMRCHGLRNAVQCDCRQFRDRSLRSAVVWWIWHHRWTIASTAYVLLCVAVLSVVVWATLAR